MRTLISAWHLELGAALRCKCPFIFILVISVTTSSHRAAAVIRCAPGTRTEALLLPLLAAGTCGRLMASPLSLGTSKAPADAPHAGLPLMAHEVHTRSSHGHSDSSATAPVPNSASHPRLTSGLVSFLGSVHRWDAHRARIIHLLQLGDLLGCTPTPGRPCGFVPPCPPWPPRCARRKSCFQLRAGLESSRRGSAQQLLSSVLLRLITSDHF